MNPRGPRFLLSSFALGTAAAFTSAGVMDYKYFQRAVDAREAVVRRQHRNVLGQLREIMDERLSVETKRARERAQADARMDVLDVAAQLKSISAIAAARQKLLDDKNRQLRDQSRLEGHLAKANSNLERVQAENEELKNHVGLLASASDGAPGKSRIGGESIKTNSTMARIRPNSSSGELNSMRAEFARQLAAEAAAKKLPKGPVYLNTPRGRVILIPAEKR